MKATLFDISGKKKSDIAMPAVFDTVVREDLAAKAAEAAKQWQAHSTYEEAGKRHSASGTISHKRHDWKGQYGKGISRTPRKNMSRRGSQFNWVGAEVSNTRGGRSIHHPVGLRYYRKINKKEMKLALNSALAATAHYKYVQQRYARLADADAHVPAQQRGPKVVVPIVIESKLDNMKFKDLKIMLKSIFGNSFDLILQHKQVRAGVGKMRGRTYKRNAGLLLVKSSKEKVTASGFDIINAKDVSITELYPLGRITMYTEKALEELGGKK